MPEMSQNRRLSQSIQRNRLKMRTGEKNPTNLSLKKKKASLNSCSLIAALEIKFPQPGSLGAALKWVVCRNITQEDTKAGPTSDVPFALLRWHWGCPAEQKQDSRLFALTPPSPIAAPDTKQPQFPQLLLTGLVLQTLHQLRCPSLDTLQHLNVSPVVRGPKLNTVFEHLASAKAWDRVSEGQPKAVSTVPRPKAAILQQQIGIKGKRRKGKAKQSQLPQPLLIRLVLQTLHQLRCPSLDTLQHLNVSLVVGGPKLNTVFEVRPHQCRVQGHDHFPTPAGHTIFDTSQDAIGFLGHLGTLLAHVQLAVNQHPQVLFCQAAFQPLFPKPVALHGVVVSQVQDLALGLVKPHTIDLGPSIQPVQSLPILKQINTPTQLGVICKLTEGALDPLVQIIDKDVKQNWPQHRALGNTACDRLPTGGWRLNHFPGQPVPMLDNPFSEEKFPNIQSKPPLAQLEAISSCPITCYLGEETNTHLSTTSFQTKQPQFPQPLVIRLVLQTLHQLRCPSLDTLQHLNVSLVVGGPKLNTVFKVRPHQCRVQGDDHFPSPAGHTISDTSQDAIGLLGHLGTLVAHIQLSVDQHPQNPHVLVSPSCRVQLLPGEANEQEERPSPCDWTFPSSEPFLEAATCQLCSSLGSAPRWNLLKPANTGSPSKTHFPDQLIQNEEDTPKQLKIQDSTQQYHQGIFHRAAVNPFIPQPVLILGVASIQVQDLALGLDEPHEFHMGPLLELVQFPLDGIPSLRHVNRTTQLGVICKLAEGALNPTVYVIDKDIEQYWSLYRRLSDTTC
ncbi:hypothetical protein QYF61_003148 [Mycteria americana]|uniref:Uncharacterized protein n=1 Tax=Mycteria americana TaxID=33587 RepID=A0AAN7RYT8_MYCAM|nr:hypothetical protein QYF61_003148 [Mycteria americana]